MLIVADALTALITMHYKAHFNRPRPTQIVPKLMSPIQHGGHASYPSGHSTQAHAFARLLREVIPPSLDLPVPDEETESEHTKKAASARAKKIASVHSKQTAIETSLGVLADRIARNREIAGLHYPSDTAAGVKLAAQITEKIFLDPDYLPSFKLLVDGARNEWKRTGIFP